MRFIPDNDNVIGSKEAKRTRDGTFDLRVPSGHMLAGRPIFIKSLVGAALLVSVLGGLSLTTSAAVTTTGSEVGYSGPAWSGSAYLCPQSTPVDMCRKKGHTVSLSIKDTQSDSKCAGAKITADIRPGTDPAWRAYNCSGNGTTRYTTLTSTATVGSGQSDFVQTKIFAITGNNTEVTVSGAYGYCLEDKAC